MSRVVLVTGGNRGIGLAIAQAFVAAGDRVAITARSGELPEALAGSDVLVVAADVTDSASVDAAFDRVEAELGPVEIAVANAGITRDTLILRMSDDDIDAVIDTNLVGALRVARRAAKGMLRLRRGRLIFVSSVVGQIGSAGPGQLRRVQGRAGRRGPLAGPRARQPRHHRQRRRPRLRRHRHDRRAPRGAPRRDRRRPSRSVATPRRTRSPASSSSSASEAAGYVTGAVVPVDGGLGMGH